MDSELIKDVCMPKYKAMLTCIADTYVLYKYSIVNSPYMQFNRVIPCVLVGITGRWVRGVC